jgi:hypothetical protein
MWSVRIVYVTIAHARRRPSQCNVLRIIDGRVAFNLTVALRCAPGGQRSSCPE